MYILTQVNTKSTYCMLKVVTNVYSHNNARYCPPNAGYSEDVFNLLVFTNPPDVINVTSERVLQNDNITVSFEVCKNSKHVHASPHAGTSLTSIIQGSFKND